MTELATIERKMTIGSAIRTIESHLPMLNEDDWDEIRKVEATLDAYKKYTAQDEGLRHEALQIGEAIVRLKWHKGRILGEMEKAKAGRPKEIGNTVLPINDNPTYSDLGINKMQASREQLVKRAFDEDRILDICAELIEKNQVPTFSYFLRLAKLLSRQIARDVATPPDLSTLESFDLMYCDPPWRYDFSETDSRKVENQYETMDMDELCALNVPANENCVLFMWATAPKLLQAVELVAAWGFEYKTHAIWDKEIIGMGYWFRGQHELLFVATKGAISPPDADVRVSSVIRAKRAQHSKKPESVYSMLESMFPHLARVELFARKTRDGWAAWGNEVNP